jgi:hypothetical protein
MEWSIEHNRNKSNVCTVYFLADTLNLLVAMIAVTVELRSASVQTPQVN